jgi:hypothetical protein
MSASGVSFSIRDRFGRKRGWLKPTRRPFLRAAILFRFSEFMLSYSFVKSTSRPRIGAARRRIPPVTETPLPCRRQPARATREREFRRIRILAMAPGEADWPIAEAALDAPQAVDS